MSARDAMGKFRLSIRDYLAIAAFLFGTVTGLAAVMAKWNGADTKFAQQDERITRLENQQEKTREQLTSIDKKTDLLLYKVDELKNQ